MSLRKTPARMLRGDASRERSVEGDPPFSAGEAFGLRPDAETTIGRSAAWLRGVLLFTPFSELLGRDDDDDDDEGVAREKGYLPVGMMAGHPLSCPRGSWRVVEAGRAGKRLVDEEPNRVKPEEETCSVRCDAMICYSRDGEWTQ